MTIGVLIFLPRLFGWACAYLPYEPLFYSEENKAYIIANYAENYVLGRCLGETSTYLIVDKFTGDVTAISNKETQELKVCFLKSAKGGTTGS